MPGGSAAGRAGANLAFMSPPGATGRRMRRFWDRRAREDAFYFVDHRLQYGNPDLEAFWAQGERDLEALLDALGIKVGGADSIVEIGCGVGRLTRPLAARATEVWAIDVSTEMLDVARRYNGGLSNVHWTLGDGRSLARIDEGSVDGCVSHVVFQHLPSPALVYGYVREMGRVLRVGGWAAFQLSNDPAAHLRPGRLTRIRWELTSALGSRPRGQAHPAWLGAAVDLDELRTAAADGGLMLERIIGEGSLFCLVGARRVSSGAEARGGRGQRTGAP